MRAVSANRRQVAMRLLAVLATASLSLAGCGRAGGDAASNSGASAGTTAPSKVFVATDDTGARITLSAPAHRIMSLTPGGTEMLFAAGAGDRIIASVLSADVPEAAKKIPRVGDATALDYEKVMNARADVVVAWLDINSATMIEKLRSLRLPVYLISATRLQDIPRSIERLGALTGNEAVAAAAATELDRKLASFAARKPTAKPTEVFYQIWEGPLYTIGGKHIISDALRLCGAHNIFDDLKWPANVIGREAIVKRDPEVIILSAPVLTAREWAGYWNYYPEMRAVANKKVKIWTDERLDRMGPGAIDAVSELCSALDELHDQSMPAAR
jgi:iron complex transport system substrate-binding protein